MTITVEKIDATLTEVERFIAAAHDARQALVDRDGYPAPMETGAARRASMDLTRALAKLRASS